MSSSYGYATAEELLLAKGQALTDHLARYAHHYIDKFGPVVKVTPAPDLLGVYHFATVTFQDGSFRTFVLGFDNEWYSHRGRGGGNGGPTYRYTLTDVLGVLAESPELHLTSTQVDRIEQRLRDHSRADFQKKQNNGR